MYKVVIRVILLNKYYHQHFLYSERRSPSVSSIDTDDEIRPLRKNRKKNPYLQSDSEDEANKQDDDTMNPELPSFMKGLVVMFVAMSDETKKQLYRYVVAYSGEVCTEPKDITTHIVVDPKFLQFEHKQVK